MTHDPQREKQGEETVKRTPIDLLAEKFMPEQQKVNFSANIPLWLVRQLDHAIAELASRGLRVTKGAIVTEALKAYLGVEGPQ